MTARKLLDDQPAQKKTDLLRFHRYLAALDQAVLKRDSDAPFVTGIYGPWGSGKSSLLRILAEELEDQNQECEKDGKDKPWLTVEFSPWLYRQEKSLFLPLLATLAKKENAVEQLIKRVIKTGTFLVKTFAAAGIEAAKLGLPLLSVLDEENKQDLQAQIQTAIAKITKNKRLVFLIDDLDRCHDPAQIVDLLEQIKLFLHLKNCVFFIGADKRHIVNAIEKKFPGEGAAYLDKFVQLGFELPPHRSSDLVALLDPGNFSADDLGYLIRVAELYQGNPRQFKKIWNQAVMGLNVLQQELKEQQPRAFDGHPKLILMLKWRLLKECGLGAEDIHQYLTLEKAEPRHGTLPPVERELLRGYFMDALRFRDKSGQWRVNADIALFLWHDLWENRFQDVRTLTLYLYSSGNDRPRLFIERMLARGDYRIAGYDFSRADLSGGYFRDVHFIDCNFEKAGLENARLIGAVFERCKLRMAKFNGAKLTAADFLACNGMDDLDTEPELYEKIADSAMRCWRNLAQDRRLPDWGAWDARQLFAMYKNILMIHRGRRTNTPETEERLREKMENVRGFLS
ncbi:MAG: AAA family ATPase [Gammaproteobacteria bacterium]|nr:AAA family ATPase [Gammaproteobacteria bacterium]